MRAARKRRLAVAAALVLAAAVAALLLTRGGDGREDGGPRTGERSQRLPELPGGGRRIFPERRVVGFYGHPAHDDLGELGIGSPRSAGRRLLKQVKPYARASDRPILPAFELLASIATGEAGADGDYSMRTDDATIGRYLRAARAIDAILILDIQPGYGDWMRETRRLRRWLVEPDVSLALDPEWKVPRGEIPGKVIGSVEAEDVNAVSDYLDRLSADRQLPQKLLLVHQFTDGMIKNRELLRPRANVAVAVNIDGFGDRAVKAAKYREFARKVGWAHKGFKLFYREDTNLMTPRQVLRLRPDPGIIIYE